MKANEVKSKSDNSNMLNYNYTEVKNFIKLTLHEHMQCQISNYKL